MNTAESTLVKAASDFGCFESQGEISNSLFKGLWQTINLFWQCCHLTKTAGCNWCLGKIIIGIQCQHSSRGSLLWAGKHRRRMMTRVHWFTGSLVHPVEKEIISPGDTTESINLVVRHRGEEKKSSEEDENFISAMDIKQHCSGGRCCVKRKRRSWK